MKPFRRWLTALFLFSAAAAFGQSAAPGTLEDRGNPLMSQVTPVHALANPAADEAVIYYVRPDGKASEWGLWLWAVPGGEGAAAWSRSSQLTVAGNVAYLKFKKDGSTVGAPVMGSAGTGVIARRLDGWTKDGDEDRLIDLTAANEWVIFSGDPKTYPFGPYRPTLEAARLVAADRIQVDLSGRQALTLEPSANGFLVTAGPGGPAYTVVDAFNTGNPADRTNNFTRRVTLVLDRPVDLGRPVVVSHPAYWAPVTANTQAVAAQRADTMVPAAGEPLGALYQAAQKSAVFRLWAPLASEVTLRLYRTSGAARADWVLPLSRHPKTGVWTAEFGAVDPAGLFYDYLVTHAGVTKTVLDPWAQAMDAFTGVGPGRGAVVDPAQTQPEGGWEGYTDYPLAQREDAVIYEVSVRDFTASPDAGTKNRPGSYLAFVEKLPYLKSLGVTHLQLMPVLNFYFNDETKTDFEATGTSSGNNYNWGYDPHNYFTPEGWFASDPSDPVRRIVELKTLIKEIHRAGMGVLLDVVYNHTASASILDDLVPGYFYRMTPEGAFRNNSGCGNDVATERTMARRLITDSLRHWVSEYRVDGFRFDLMGLMDVDTILQGRALVAQLPGKADILFVGEGWKMYTGPKAVKTMDQTYMNKTDQVSVFNDEFRSLLKGGGLDDRAKGFLTDKPISPKIVLSNLWGRPQLNYKTSWPGNNLQYTEAHDNLTMHDNISLNLGLSDDVPEQRAELAARLRLGNFLVLTSQGIAFLHSGQESGRTKPKLNSRSEVLGSFLHNSYDAADNINAFSWNPLPEYRALADFTRGLIQIRRTFGAFRLGDARAIEAAASEVPGSDILSLGWSLKTAEGTFTMLVNASGSPRTFAVGRSLKAATVLVDGDRASAAGLERLTGASISGHEVTVQPLTAVMFKE